MRQNPWLVARLGIAIALLICATLGWSQPAHAQAAKYAPPPSYSNAELRKHDFSGEELRSAEFSNANLDQANFTGAKVRGGVFSASVLTDAILHGADL
ncbi:MAG: pentapeptide repeat-containing protein, partial [Cyanobacteriota bacterium]